ncbi:RluA family pseudouridine synthase [Flavobacterium urocaniciphilum]|uniref:tRNA pseudouridine32 synthase / 23S rRNA pseudouridine746 synthase n=1 Tax=Flavobacterium urocaniciphilum TaxID=1299341 RepID=A0A1H8YTX2_9FLAO|nr:RluA family pseudouridine synthase [Flavobacterium urocaniciphilum]SEP55569.1 tRNA pseudouridine32 synthase / 23S rRNA pseudouridine746 synthase [Flavobacterium urocaniciphilum]
MQNLALFQSFQTDISGISLPEKFTFPFYYQPHELSKIAASELQMYLDTQTDFEHNFGLNDTQTGLVIGKMFGVLVCQNNKGELGYLWAFSGKLANENHHNYFVPTVFDMLTENSFFLQEEKLLNEYNRKIESLEKDGQYLNALENLKNSKIQAESELQQQKTRIKEQKILRDEKRNSLAPTLSEEELQHLNFELSEDSKQESILLKKMTKYWKLTLQSLEEKVLVFTSEINQLKEERKAKSSQLQQKLFAEYSFLNQFKEKKSIGEIFNDNPPAGAGECAAPKLLHYAFQHELKPICMAEFWWGQSPKSEVRQHKHFYPACKSKCEPILMEHMLLGLEMDENPFKVNPAEGKDIEVVYEDDVMLAINKPAEFLSVPGKTISDSVYARMAEKYPDATGPLIVHRLDMSTSGIMLIAKNEETYIKLQSQFINRTIKKRYVALLDGLLEKTHGYIDLPLRVDLDDRPRQLVCYEYGKPAQTKWKTIEVKNGKTKVYFYPITGRTHQLRVHASHSLGLHTPIVGDDLYGDKADRLHLHAEYIQFEHPISKEVMEILVEAEF